MGECVRGGGGRVLGVEGGYFTGSTFFSTPRKFEWE